MKELKLVVSAFFVVAGGVGTLARLIISIPGPYKDGNYGVLWAYAFMVIFGVGLLLAHEEKK